MEGLKGLSGSNLRVHLVHVIVSCSILLAGAGCNGQKERMESDQLVLEQKIDANARRIALLASHYQKSQMRLSEDINEVRRGNEVTLAESLAVRYEQRRMREDTQAYDEKWHAGMMRIEDSQLRLQGSVEEVEGQAQQIDRRVVLIGDGQADFRHQWTEDEKRMTSRLGLMTENQQELYSKVLDDLAIDEGIAVDLDHVQAEQQRAQQAREASHRQWVGQLSSLSEHQNEMQASLDRNHRVAQGIADGVTKVQAGQAGLRTQVEAGTSVLRGDLGRLSQGQQSLGEQMASEHELLAGKLDSVTSAQKQTYLGLNDVKEDTTRISRQTTSIQGQQASLHELVRRYQQDLTEANRRSTEGQALLRGSLDRVYGTTQDLSQASVSLREAVEGYDARLAQVAADARHVQQKTFDEVEGLSRRQEQTHLALNRIEGTAGALQEVMQGHDGRLAQVAADAGQARQRTSAEIASLSRQQQETHLSLNNRIEDTSGALQAAIQGHDTRLTQVADDAGQARQRTFAEMAGLSRQQQETRQTVDLVRDRTDQVFDQGGSLLALQRQSLDDLTDSDAGLALQQQALTDSIAAIKEAFAELARKADAIVAHQGTLSHMIQTKSGDFEGFASTVQRDQQRVDVSLTGLKETADQVSQDTDALRAGQDRLNREVLEQLDQVQQNQAQLRERMEERDDTVTETLIGLEGRQTEWEDLAQTWGRQALALEGKIGAFEEAFQGLLSDLDGRVVGMADTLEAIQKDHPQANARIREDLRQLTKTLEYIKGSQGILTDEIEKVRIDSQEYRQEFMNAVGDLKEERDGHAVEREYEATSE